MTEKSDAKSDTRCPHASDCPLFERFRVSSALRIWQVFFCDARYLDCKRYEAMRDGRPIPATLLPDGSDLEEIG